jgi:hypothetical protein
VPENIKENKKTCREIQAAIGSIKTNKTPGIIMLERKMELIDLLESLTPVFKHQDQKLSPSDLEGITLAMQYYNYKGRMLDALSFQYRQYLAL